ncbi:MAG: DNA ligase [Burkholderiales bacterium]|nr:MAG: DNA ligase [Betaproteobacteria bacterium]TAG84536.1 MAG: DNA ligase [Burkholderiales bacterium]
MFALPCAAYAQSAPSGTPPTASLPVSSSAAPKDAPRILLANVLAPHIDVTQYLVSEKYDGVRAIWDGTTLRFRSGRTLIAPTWFTERLPARALDGELWIARGRFDEVSAIVRRETPINDEWQRVSYMIFELPQATENEGLTFAERVSEIATLVAATNFAPLKAVPQYRVKDRVELKRALDRVVRAGGEGLMLHRADARYVTGRSDVLLKLKPLLDTEARVIGHVPGKGKHAGKMGALLLETKEGVRFKLGTGFSDAQRANPPAIGSLVTYTYRELTKSGRPRFASFVRERVDP